MFSVLVGVVFVGPMMSGGVCTKPSGRPSQFALVSGLLWNIALSAVRGYLGVYVATEMDLGSEAIMFQDTHQRRE